jgi:hypothetical protein
MLGVYLEEKAFGFTSLQLGDTFLLLTQGTPAPGFGRFRWQPVEVLFFNGALNLPAAYLLVVGIFVDDCQFFLTVTDMLFAQVNNATLFFGIYNSFSFVHWSAVSVVQADRVILVVPGQPFVETLPGNVEVATDKTGIPAVALIVLKPLLTLFPLWS